MPGFARSKNEIGLDPEKDLNGLLQMILELASEISVLSDRVSVLTNLLEAQGVVSDEAIDRFVPEGALSERLKTDKLRLTRRLVTALRGEAADLSQLI